MGTAPVAGEQAVPGEQAAGLVVERVAWRGWTGSLAPEPAAAAAWALPVTDPGQQAGAPPAA